MIAEEGGRTKAEGPDPEGRHKTCPYRSRELVGRLSAAAVGHLPTVAQSIAPRFM